MKKTILLLVVLALLVPAAALAATEFSLGGYIKLETYWDSTQNSKTTQYAIPRNNDQLGQHGHFDMTAQGSRFNFTIKGPDVWGAHTTGFIEMDFDGNADTVVSGGGPNAAIAAGPPTATNSMQPRLRHAMFRLNWPETELMFGQYWGMFSEYAPEVMNDAAMMLHGWANQRIPQIRVSQKFLSDFTVAAAIMKPYSPGATDSAWNNNLINAGPNAPAVNTTLGMAGQNSESPQVQAKLAYEKDLWGKAAFYGRPRGFVAQVTAGWQRTQYRANQLPVNFETFGANTFVVANPAATGSFQLGNVYLNPWEVQGSLFIPVIPTYSANLAGTASLSGQWFVGQGVSAFGQGRDQDNSWFLFKFGGGPGGPYYYERKLMQQTGGYAQVQYYFNNQWFLNAAWGAIFDYGINRGRAWGAYNANNWGGYKYATLNDQQSVWSELDLVLWYRPVEALKFGVGYAYERSDYFQKVNNPNFTALPHGGQFGNGSKDVGESHRIEFVAYMFF